VCNLLEVPVFQKLVGRECRISTKLFHTSCGKLDVKPGRKVLAADSNQTDGRVEGSTLLFHSTATGASSQSAITS